MAVNVKMGVSGVAQFKSSMTNAKNAVKTLDEQLKLNEKQFKATGDSEEYMSTKAELLKTKLAEQKAMIANAEKALAEMAAQGVDKASASYQKMQQELLRARGSLLDTEGELQNIGQAGSDAGDGVDEMNSQLRRIGDQVSFQTVTEGIGKITDGLENIAKKAMSAGKAMIEWVFDQGSVADTIKTNADVWGVSWEDAQRMEYAAKIVDTSVEDMISARSKLYKGIGSADTGVMGAFSALLPGWDPGSHEAEDNFWAIGEAIMNLADVEEQEAYAQKAFGRSWKELRPLFKAGREGYESALEEASVVSDGTIEKLGEVDDAREQFLQTWQTTEMELAGALAGPLTDALTVLNGVLGQFNEYLQSEDGQKMLEKLGEAVSELISDLSEIDPEEVVNNIVAVFDQIKEGFQWLIDHKQQVVDALKWIVAGWAGLKLTGGGLRILQLISGLKGLNLGGGGSLAADAGTGLTTADGGGASSASLLTSKAAMLAAAVTMLYPLTQLDYKKIFEDAPEYHLGDITHNAGTVMSSGYTGMDYLNFLTGKHSGSGSGRTLTQEDINLINSASQRPAEDAWTYDQIWQRNQYLGDQMAFEMQDAIDRLASATEAGANVNERMAANSLTSSDVSTFKGVPAAIEQAVRNGMKGIAIYIDGTALNNYVAVGMGGTVRAMTK